jgi:hypothetical protein
MSHERHETYADHYSKGRCRPERRRGGEGATRLGADFELVGPEAPLPPELDGGDPARLCHLY